MLFGRAARTSDFLGPCFARDLGRGLSGKANVGLRPDGVGPSQKPGQADFPWEGRAPRGLNNGTFYLGERGAFLPSRPKRTMPIVSEQRRVC